MSDQAFRLLFGKTKEEVSLEEINTQMGESGKEVKVLDFKHLLPQNNNAVHITSNGFSLCLLNPEEYRDKDGKFTAEAMYETKGKYKLVYPDWTDRDGELNYQDGTRLLRERAKEYQEKLYSETPEYIQDLIKKEAEKLRDSLTRATERGEDTKYENSKIELFESDPVKYWTEKKDDALDTLDFILKDTELTEEYKQEAKIRWGEIVAKLQKVIDTVKADFGK